VASSELRRSIVRQVQPKLDAPQEIAPEIIGALPETRGFNSDAIACEPVISAHDVFLEALWFRPPPAL